MGRRRTLRGREARACGRCLRQHDRCAAVNRAERAGSAQRRRWGRGGPSVFDAAREALPWWDEAFALGASMRRQGCRQPERFFFE